MAPPPLAARRRRWILILSAAGLSSYAAYRIYHLPSISTKRRNLCKLFSALFSVADAVSSSADAVSLLSSDLNHFLQSDSEEIPQSLKQLAKIARSDAFSSSISKISDALAVGIIRGFGDLKTNPSFSVRLVDNLFSEKGSGFASVVVGSFARNMVMGLYSRGEGTELIANNMEIFARTAVAVYLEKTMKANTFEDLFSSLTNPKHEAQVKDILVSVCNAAVETFVKTCHCVLSSSNSSSSSSSSSATNSGGLVEQVSSVLAIPSNRRFVRDVTGRVTFESVRSFLKFVIWKSQEGMKGSVNAVNEKVVERGLDVLRYLSAKALFSLTLCIALCIRLADGPTVLLAA